MYLNYAWLVKIELSRNTTTLINQDRESWCQSTVSSCSTTLCNAIRYPTGSLSCRHPHPLCLCLSLSFTHAHTNTHCMYIFIHAGRDKYREIEIEIEIFRTWRISSWGDRGRFGLISPSLPLLNFHPIKTVMITTKRLLGECPLGFLFYIVEYMFPELCWKLVVFCLPFFIDAIKMKEIK